MKRIIYILFFIISVPTLDTQEINDVLDKNYYNWHFRFKCGITFMTPDNEPVYLDGSKLKHFYFREGHEIGYNNSTISNINGKYSFHTDGVYLQDANYNLIHEDMGGHSYQSQGSILVPLIDNKFMFISCVYAEGGNPTPSTKFQNRNYHDTTGLIYSIFTYDSNNVNNKLNFIKKGEILNQNYLSEAIAVTYSFETGNYILIAHDKRGTVFAYEFDLEGNILRENKQFLFESKERLYCNIRINKMGDKIAISNTQGYEDINNKPSEIFISQFNSKTLEFSNSQKVNIDSLMVWSLEFSPNSRFLYFYGKHRYGAIHKSNGETIISKEVLFRYDGWNDKLDTIYKDYPPIDDKGEYDGWRWDIDRHDTVVAGAWELLIGPNNKIYIARGGANHLSSLETPDSEDDPGYKVKAVMIDKVQDHDTVDLVNGELPNIITSSFTDLFVKSCITVCVGGDIQLLSKLKVEDPDAGYHWTGPNGFESFEQNPVIDNARLENSGIYNLTVNSNGKEYNAETYVEVSYIEPHIEAYPDTLACAGDSVELYLASSSRYVSYDWNTGETTESIIVNESGTYSVNVIDTNGCEGFSEISVRITEDTSVTITGPNIICYGKEANLSSKQDFEKYYWSNGENEKSITVSEAKEYILTAITEEGCAVRDTFELKTHPEIETELEPFPESICKGDTLILKPKITKSSYEYIWNTGEITESLIVTESGAYKLVVTDTETNCKDSTEVTIRVEDELTPTIEGEDICGNENVTLTAIPNDDSYSYEWSTGDTTASIEVSKPDVYSVVITKGNCKGEASFTVEKHELPDFEIVGDTIVCEGSKAEISSSKEFEEYLWSTEETTRSIRVGTGTYTLTVTDSNGCSATKDITIKEGAELHPIIEGKNICGNETVTLTAIPNDDSYSYEWNTGETTASIEVSEAGEYTVAVTKDNCSGEAKFEVEQFPLPEFTIEGDRIICEGETTTLTSSKEFDKYEWSNGETTISITVGEGDYTLTVTDENGCTATEPVSVEEKSVDIAFESMKYDFGKVYISKTRDTTIEITNNSGEEVTAIIDGDQVNISEDGYTHQYNLDNSSTGEKQDFITIQVTEPCEAEYQIEITAEVYARVTLSSIDLHTEIGATETIPFYIEAEADLGEQEFNITTDIERDLFFTNDSYQIPSPQVINQQRSKIHEQTGMILLTEFSNYPITFPQVQFDDPYIEKDTSSGKITFDSVCIHDLRVVEIHEPTEISVAPNPVHDIINIDISTGEEGNFTIELISTEGRTTYTDSWNQSSSSKNIQIDTRDISTGVYQIRLTTEGHVYRKEVVVVD